MARIPYPDIESDRGGISGATNIYRMLGWAGPVNEGFTHFGTQLRDETELDPILREIAILRVGILSGSSYEVNQHSRIARDIGMADETLAAVLSDAESPCLSDLQREVVRFTNSVVRDVRAPDAVFDPVARTLGYRRLQELLMNIGFYMMISRLLENLDVEIEDMDAFALQEEK